jgi:tetratricopeptide (TPR) repeat protein
MGKKPKSKKKTSGKIWILVLILALGFCAWVYWGNIPERPRPVSPPARPQAVAPGGGGQTGMVPGGVKSSLPAGKPTRSVAGKINPADNEEQSLMEKIQRSEAAGRMEEAARSRFELSDLYLQKALWEWTEFGRKEPDPDLIRGARGELDEVIRRRPGTELAAEAQLRRAKIYHNGLSGLWDQAHRKEAREELNKVLEAYPRSSAAREAREMLANLGK